MSLRYCCRNRDSYGAEFLDAVVRMARGNGRRTAVRVSAPQEPYRQPILSTVDPTNDASDGVILFFSHLVVPSRSNTVDAAMPLRCCLLLMLMMLLWSRMNPRFIVCTIFDNEEDRLAATALLYRFDITDFCCCCY